MRVVVRSSGNDVRVVGASMVKYMEGLDVFSLSGAKCQDLFPFIEEHSALDGAKIVVLFVGANNVKSTEGYLDSFRHYKILVSKMVGESPNLRVVVSSIVPRATSVFTSDKPENRSLSHIQEINVKISKLNKSLADFCSGHRNLVFLDLSPLTVDVRRILGRDGLHFNRFGSKVVAQEISKFVKTPGREVPTRRSVGPQVDGLGKVSHVRSSSTDLHLEVSDHGVDSAFSGTECTYADVVKVSRELPLIVPTAIPTSADDQGSMAAGITRSYASVLKSGLCGNGQLVKVGKPSSTLLAGDNFRSLTRQSSPSAAVKVGRPSSTTVSGHITGSRTRPSEDSSPAKIGKPSSTSRPGQSLTRAASASAAVKVGRPSSTTHSGHISGSRTRPSEDSSPAKIGKPSSTRRPGQSLTRP